MAYEKLLRLLSTLIHRTDLGTAKWSAGARDDTFLWSGSSGSVVMLTKDNDGMAPYVVRVLDTEGRVVDEDEFSPAADGFDIVYAVYDRARRSALNVDKTLDSLLDELDDPPF